MATQYVPSTPQRCEIGFQGMQSPVRSSTKHDRPLYHSPRCENPDEQFVAPPETLKTYEDRWQHMSQQAGSHQQDGSVLTVTRRVSPHALRSGTPPQVAARVRVLRLDIDEKDNLPEWLDVISALFFQLEHLHLSQMPCDNNENARMRRLYVLYRLPGLLSIDGKDVTELERQLARPQSPNGHRVQREEWVSLESFTFDSEDTNDSEEHGDAVEVSLKGIVKRTQADVPSEELDESDWECPLKLSREDTVSEVRESSESDDPYCAMNTTTCGGLSLSAFVEQVPEAQVDNNSSPGLQTPLHTPSEPLETTPKVEPSDETDVVSQSAESTPERLIAEAGCITRSLTLTSPFPLIFRGDGTLEEILERNKQTTPPPVIGPPLGKHGSVTSTKVSPPQKVTHSRSLSSPFPMQFQKKDEQSPSTTYIDSPKSAGDAYACKKETEETSSVEMSLEKDGPAAVKEVVEPRLSPPPTEGRKVMVIRRTSQATPPRSGVSRPPTCPASRRTVPVPRTKMGKRFGCWRPRKFVRSKSIVDDAEDDSSTDEEDEAAELVVTQG